MRGFNAEMFLVAIAMLIHSLTASNLVSIMNNGDNLHHNVATSKDVRVEDQVTSLLTSLVTAQDRVRSRGGNSRHTVATSKDVYVENQVTSLLQSSKAVPNRLRRATKPCDVDCSRVKDKPACATDRQIYRQKCELKRIRRCEGRRVRAIPMGFCTGHFEHTQESKCLQKRRLALSRPIDVAMSSYIPRCTPEGAFQDLQCHIETGYCWCVTSDGDPIPRTSTHDADVEADDVTCKSSKVCTPRDRTEFNRQLVESFVTEYRMTTKSVAKISSETVAEWKFNQLDANFDRLLRRKEIRALKRLVKKIVQPKSCTKTFDTYCDLEGDTKVTLIEWTLCLGINNNRVSSPSNRNDHSDDFTHISMTSQRRNSDAEEDKYDVMGVFSPSLLDYNHNSPENTDGFETNLNQQSLLMENDNNVLDCLSERQMAIQLDKLELDGHVFIPDCLATGHYAPAQCHTSTGYCWCVDDITGRPLPGTSTHNVKPDCDATSREYPRQHPDEGTEFLTFPIPT